MARKPLPIGVDDFKKLITHNYYYVDKSLLIKDIVDQAAEVLCLLRPRRFGKTLNLSMLRYFFDCAFDDNESLFEGLDIARQGEAYMKLQGQSPVISITLKDVKYSNWPDARAALRERISSIYSAHDYLLDGDTLSDYERTRYKQILQQKDDMHLYGTSLQHLSDYLERHYHKKTIILIDEYDSPIHESFNHGYEDDMIAFMRVFLGSALKGNPHLDKAVITGILRIARESLFSDLNNLEVRTILDDQYSQYFGLLEDEVQQILAEYDLTDTAPEVRQWYNGYRIGSNTNVYNPWSIISFVKSGGKECLSYWHNTGNPQLIKRALAASDDDTKMALESLLNGEVTIQTASENLTVTDIARRPSAIWSVLLYSGYLTTQPTANIKRPEHALTIPNLEVFGVYRQIVLDWFEEGFGKGYLLNIGRHLASGDILEFKTTFITYVEQALSYFDVGTQTPEPEKFYHAFVLGILVHCRDLFDVRSNRESGTGRYDVMLFPKDKSKTGYVIEFKRVSKPLHETMASAIELAKNQIKDRDYAAELRHQGIKNIIGLAIAFEGKVAQIEEVAV